MPFTEFVHLHMYTNYKYFIIMCLRSYKQQKFNLFREESEGYAKLVAELNQPVGQTSVKYITQVVQCLIGKSIR